MTVTEIFPVERHARGGLAAPPDTDAVRAAVRLGWYLAELRGRYWWRGVRPATSTLPAEPPFALPLRPERTPAEARRQTRETVTALAARLDPVDPLAGGPRRPFPDRLAPLLARLEADEARLLSADAPAAEKEAAWTPLAALLHEWDGCLQDALAARADVLANAYLLGRGLAESYWALGPDGGSPPAPSACDLAFLFGRSRRAELARLVGRVGDHVNAMTPSAVAGSIEAWGAVAADPAWQDADGDHAHLYEQLRRWYELLVLGRDPSTLVKPYAVLRDWRAGLHAFRAYLPQLLLALLGVAAVAALIVVLGTDGGSMMLSGLLGLSGAVGLTAATVTARAKSTGQRLVARLRQDAYSDLVAVAVSCIPPHPHAGRGRPFGAPTTEQRVRTAVRARPITPPTPVPVVTTA